MTEMRSVMVRLVARLLADVQPADRAEVASIAAEEIKLEQALLGNSPIIESQLVNSQRKLEALGNLCESLVSQSSLPD